MFYSVLIDSEVVINSITLTDQTDKNIIKSDILVPYLQGEEFFVDGYRLNKSKISRIKIVASEQSIQSLVDFKNEQKDYENRISDVYVVFTYASLHIMNDEKLVRDITAEILKEVKTELKNSKSTRKKSVINNKRVFIVHGHDDKIKLDVARFLEKLNLEPVILHEQANQGKTIIEKIESETDVGYGIVLYTPCDKGGTKDTDFENMKFRARQNVIFEHGFLIARLGRDRVCALLDGDVEQPSDIDGVLYVKYQGDWKLTVAKELSSAGYDIDFNKFVMGG